MTIFVANFFLLTVTVFSSSQRHKGCQFLDVEADLSEEGGEGVSSDEDDGEELNCTLEGFVVNNTECSQGLNGETLTQLLVEERLNLLGLDQSVYPLALSLPPAGRL